MLESAIGGLFFQFMQALDTLPDGLVVGEHATQPALIDVRGTDPVGLFSDHLGRSPLGTNQQDLVAASRQSTDLDQRCIQCRNGMFEVDDVDLVPGAKDVRSHLGIPEARLVAEVHASGQHVRHANSHIFISGLTLRRSHDRTTSRLFAPASQQA